MFHFLYDLRDMGCYDYAELYDLVIPRFRFVLSQLKEDFVTKSIVKTLLWYCCLKLFASRLKNAKSKFHARIFLVIFSTFLRHTGQTGFILYCFLAHL